MHDVTFYLGKGVCDFDGLSSLKNTKEVETWSSHQKVQVHPSPSLNHHTEKSGEKNTSKRLDMAFTLMFTNSAATSSNSSKPRCVRSHGKVAGWPGWRPKWQIQLLVIWVVFMFVPSKFAFLEVKDMSRKFLQSELLDTLLFIW